MSDSQKKIEIEKKNLWYARVLSTLHKYEHIDILLFYSKIEKKVNHVFIGWNHKKEIKLGLVRT